jgi:hypothetical protein
VKVLSDADASGCDRCDEREDAQRASAATGAVDYHATTMNAGSLAGKLYDE